MKIRNKFIIPLIAIIVAMLMVGGSVSGTAADTSASESSVSDTSTTHPLTYIPPTPAPTSSLDEEIDALVSNIMTGIVSDPDQVGDDIRETSSIMDKFLTAITNFIDMIINFVKQIGDKLSNW